MDKEEEIRRLEELIKDENPAFHRWISKVEREIEKLKNESKRFIKRDRKMQKRIW